MGAKESFEAAYERLLHGRPEICAKGDPINIANVAKEAGRQRSALRAGRGFDDLIEKIKKHVEQSDKKRSGRDQVKAKAAITGYVEQLERENNQLKSQNMALVLRLYRMEKALKDLNVDIPKNLGEVVEIRHKIQGISESEF